MKIAVIGLGLIGASLAKSLAGRAEITGIDRDLDVVGMAMRDGVISRGGDDPSLARGCDMAVIALPVGSIVDAAGSLLPHLDPDTPLTDTGSTKARIAREIESLWPCFVGSHPIAGKEKSGYCASQPDLFAGSPCIITPGLHTHQGCIHRVRQLWESCGSHVTIMDPVQHDRLMAVISHMPHLLSFASMGLAGDLHIHRGLLGAGFKDFTRIAASDPVMWRDIFLDNSGHVLKLLDDYVRELGLIRKLIEGRDAAGLEERLRTYSNIRRNLYEDNQ